MIILGIRTDKPEAELYLYNSGQQLAAIKWQAHLKLAETLNNRIEKILNKSSISYSELEGIAIYKGPGSFTGLRIGMSVANSLAYAQNIPIMAKSSDDWLSECIKALSDGQDDKIAAPRYGAPVHTTRPKK